MLNRLCQFLLVLLSVTAAAQIRGTVKDKTTKEPIPYVNIWVEGENNGTSADENGLFTLEKADKGTTIIFSAVGYAELRIKTEELKEEILLASSAIELNELVITPKKNKKKRIVNPMDAIEETYFASACPSRSPRMVARFIPYKESYAETPFIDKINFLTLSDVRNAIFYVRIYSVGKNGGPGELLHDEPIEGKVIRKKKDITTVDVSGLNIRIPEDGCFIAIEWLIIKRNEYIMYTAHSGKKGEIYYTPKFKNVYLNREVGGWVYEKGKWRHESGRHDNRLYAIAMELTLTD